MVTKKSYYAIDDVDSLRTEIDERDAILSKYGKTYGEDDEGVWTFEENKLEDYKDQYTALEAKYAGISARYAELLNNPEPTHAGDVIVDDFENDIHDTNYDDLTINDLITDKED